MFGIEPKVHLVEEVKPSPVDHGVAIGLLFRPEKDRRREDTFEPLDKAVIMIAVRSKLKEFKHIRSSLEDDSPILLSQCQSCNPNRDQATLSKRESVVRVTDDTEKEFSTVSTVGEPVARRSAQWNTTEDKRSSMEGKLLFAIVTLFANEPN
jgi:hypothetical protein